MLNNKIKITIGIVFITMATIMIVKNHKLQVNTQKAKLTNIKKINDKTNGAYETYINTGNLNSEHIFKTIAYGLSLPDLPDNIKCNANGKEEPDTCGYTINRTKNSIELKRSNVFYKDIFIVHDPKTKKTKLNIYCHYILNSQYHITDKQCEEEIMSDIKKMLISEANNYHILNRGQVFDKINGNTITVSKTNEDFKTKIAKAVINSFEKYNIPYISNNYKHYKLLYVNDPGGYILTKIFEKIELNSEDKKILLGQIKQDITEKQLHKECEEYSTDNKQYSTLIPNASGNFYIPLTKVVPPAIQMAKYCNDRYYTLNNVVKLQKTPGPPNSNVLKNTSGDKDLVIKLIGVKIEKNENLKYNKLSNIIVSESKKYVILKLNNVIPGLFKVNELQDKFDKETIIGTKIVKTILNKSADDIVRDLVKKE
jgi:hypothetical protein